MHTQAQADNAQRQVLVLMDRHAYTRVWEVGGLGATKVGDQAAYLMHRWIGRMASRASNICSKQWFECIDVVSDWCIAEYNGLNVLTLSVIAALQSTTV